MNSEKLKKIMPKGVKLHQRLKLHQKRKITPKDYSRIF